MREWRERMKGKMKIFFVVPDYYEQRPKRCVNGWGTTLATIAPDGAALPCHTARMLPGLSFPNVREQSMREIWFDSDAFNRFRGFGWMKEPCASCEEREKDLGGCRCQAYLLALRCDGGGSGVVRKSPHHQVLCRLSGAATACGRAPHGGSEMFSGRRSRRGSEGVPVWRWLWAGLCFLAVLLAGFRDSRASSVE